MNRNLTSAIATLIPLMSGLIMLLLGLSTSFGGDAYTYIVKGIFIGFGCLLLTLGFFILAAFQSE